MAHYFATYLSIVEKGDTRKMNEKDLQNKRTEAQEKSHNGKGKDGTRD